MKKIKIGNINLELYDSIDDLPIKRFYKFNKFMLVDSGIGSDLNDVSMKILSIQKHIGKDEVKARVELENLRQSLYLISEELNAKHLAFSALIYSIDGEVVTDISDDNLKDLIHRISDAPSSKIYDYVEALKKNFNRELDLYFPNQFNSASSKEYFDRLKRRVILRLDEIIEGVKNSDKIQEIDDFLFSLSDPKPFSGKNSVEIEYHKQFEEMSLFLQKNLSVSISEMSTLQFYNAFEYLKKMLKQQKGK